MSAERKALLARAIRQSMSLNRAQRTLLERGNLEPETARRLAALKVEFVALTDALREYVTNEETNA